MMEIKDQGKGIVEPNLQSQESSMRRHSRKLSYGEWEWWKEREQYIMTIRTLREEKAEMRKLLKEASSMLGIILHWGRVKWGTLGLPLPDKVEELIGKLKNAWDKKHQ